MKVRTKAWLLTAAALVLLGCILFAGILFSEGWEISTLSTIGYETNTYEISETFHNISLMTDIADITFEPSADGRCTVICHEEAKARHRVCVETDTLRVEVSDKRTLYNFIGINFDTPKITIYLPETAYAALLIEESTGNIEMPEGFSFADVDISLSTGNVAFCASASGQIKIKTSTGNITAKALSADSLDLTVSTGRVTVTDVRCAGDVTVGVSTGKASLTELTCKNLTSTGSTGELMLARVIAEEKISAQRSTGNVTFDGADAAEIFVKTETGDVKGSLLTNKVFLTQTDLGDIDVPKTTDGGLCEIHSNTGDIKLEIG